MPTAPKKPIAASNVDLKLNEMDSFESLIAQRAEATGASGGTFTVPGFGREWHIVAPELASTEWNDAWEALQEDSRTDAISFADFRREFVEIFLGDEADDFVEACESAQDGAGIDPMQLIRWALEEYGERRGKTQSRGRSVNSRKPRKRR